MGSILDPWTKLHQKLFSEGSGLGYSPAKCGQLFSVNWQLKSILSEKFVYFLKLWSSDPPGYTLGPESLCGSPSPPAPITTALIHAVNYRINESSKLLEQGRSIPIPWVAWDTRTWTLIGYHKNLSDINKPRTFDTAS